MFVKRIVTEYISAAKPTIFGYVNLVSAAKTDEPVEIFFGSRLIYGHEDIGVDKGGRGGPAPPNCRAEKIFFVKIEGLLEPVVLNLSFRVRSNAMFTSERRY